MDLSLSAISCCAYAIDRLADAIYVYILSNTYFLLSNYVF